MTVALLDACVLYSAALRDLLLWLAAEELYSPRWTEAIHEEWIRNLLQDRPNLTRARLERTRNLMNRVDPDCLVSGYEVHIPSLTLPDPDDRHVLAAAIHANASFLVTFNLRDFPSRALSSRTVLPLHPDQFLCGLLDRHPAEFYLTVAKHLRSLKSPPKTVDTYLDHIRQQGLTGLVERLSAKKDEIRASLAILSGEPVHRNEAEVPE